MEANYKHNILGREENRYVCVCVTRSSPCMRIRTHTHTHNTHTNKPNDLRVLITSLLKCAFCCTFRRKEILKKLREQRTLFDVHNLKEFEKITRRESEDRKKQSNRRVFVFVCVCVMITFCICGLV